MLDKLNLRELESNQFVIAEDKKDYTLAFVRKQMPMGEAHIFHLWRVTLADKSIHYVLAQCKHDAIGQASCILELDYYAREKLEWGAEAEVVPFKIRGWSHHTF